MKSNKLKTISIIAVIAIAVAIVAVFATGKWNFAANASPAQTATGAPAATPTAAPTPTIAVTPSKSQLDEFTVLASGKEISAISKATFDKLTADMSAYDAAKLLGKTKRSDKALLYLVYDGNDYSFCPINIISPLDSMNFIPFKNFPVLQHLGTPYADFIAGKNYSFELPAESEVKALLDKVSELRLMFYRQKLQIDKSAGKPGEGTVIDGKSGYFKVIPGQAYSTLDEITADLRKYFSEENVQSLLSLKVYAMYNGELYSQWFGGMGGYGPFEGLWVEEINDTSAVIKVKSLLPAEADYSVATFTLKLIDGTWKVI